MSKPAVRRADTSYLRGLQQSDAEPHSYSYCYSDANSYSHSNTYSYRYSPACANTKLRANTEAASHAPARL